MLAEATLWPSYSTWSMPLKKMSWLAQVLRTPGTSPKVMAVLNGTLFLLLVTIILMLAFLDSSIHTIILLLLAIALTVSINWFVGQLKQE